MSLDGYTADRGGNFDWAERAEGVHTVLNNLDRLGGTYLLGRRMYEVMIAWETPHAFAGQRPLRQKGRPVNAIEAGGARGTRGDSRARPGASSAATLSTMHS